VGKPARDDSAAAARVEASARCLSGGG
jgi:hypothetical protein